jgi:FYVE/RhoGEF/PH domain-containing protein 5/6
MPIQRVPRYVLLISEILTNTSKDHPDYNGLTEIHEEFKVMTLDINLTVKKQEEIEKTRKIIKKI